MTQIATVLQGGQPSFEPPASAFPSSFLEWLETKKRDQPFNKEELEDLKKEYKREYHKAYYYKRKKKNPHAVIRMTQKEYSTLKGYAKEHNKTLSAFVKETVFAYLDNSYVPRDIDQINAIQNEVRSIGNNINQIVHRIHRLKYEKAPPTVNEEIKVIGKLYETLLANVQEIEIKATEGIKSTPSTLTQSLMEYVEYRPDKIDELIDFLQRKKDIVKT